MTAAELYEFWSMFVAAKIGITAPSTGHARWLRLHRSEAVACMEATDYTLMVEQIGDML